MKIESALLVAVVLTMTAAKSEQIEYSTPDPVAVQNTTQSAKWTDVLGGRVVPLSVQVKTLDSTWRSFRLEADRGSFVRDYYSSIDLNAFNVYYSQGKTLLINNETYMVTYRLKRPVGDSLTGRLEEQDILKAMILSPNTVLVLSLLNLRTTDNFNDIVPFDSAKFNQVVDESRSKVLRNQSARNLRTLMTGVMQWSQENNELLPPMQSSAALKKAIYSYIASNTTFIQPETNQPYIPNVTLSGKSLEKIAAPSSIAALYEAKASSDGKRGVAFTNGVVHRVTATEWAKIKKASKIK